MRWPWRKKSPQPPRPRATGERIELGGRLFISHDTLTVAQDEWVMGCLNRSGLLDGLTQRQGESFEDFGLRVVAETTASGELRRLMAALLMPAGVAPRDWSPEIAEESALHFGALGTDDPVWRGLLAAALIRFFQSGLVSLRSAPASSEAVDTQPVMVAPSPHPTGIS